MFLLIMGCWYYS